MPRNLVKNHFESAGIYVEGQRSVFNFNKPVLSSFMAGMLVPMGDPIPVFPGVKLDLAIDSVIRSNTMVVPPLDGLYIDYFSVFVPHRIVWNHFPQFLGENDTTAWTQSNEYVYPYVEAQKLMNGYGYLKDFYEDTYSEGSIFPDVTCGNISLCEHYGLNSPVDLGASHALYGKHLNILSLRGYYSLWNYLFRDENYQRPVLFSKGDTGDTGEFGYRIKDYIIGRDLEGSPDDNEIDTDAFNDYLLESVEDGLGSSYFPLLMPVNKFHDAFTSVLPQPQFGDAVTLPLGGTADIIGAASMHSIGTNGLKLGTNATTAIGGAVLSTASTTAIKGNLSYVAGEAETSTGTVNAWNAVADLSHATAATINQLRTSIMYQRYIEALARSGRRVPEVYSAIYQVKNTMAAHDYPELIAQRRFILGVNQVVATADGSGEGWTSHLGDTGAYSLTNLRNIPICEKDFSEFGFLHIVYCVRADNRYSLYTPQHFFNESLLDEYNPFFDHIGDVGIDNFVFNKLVAKVNSGKFGFQEAWWHERTQVAMQNGALNKVTGSLKYWTLGEALSAGDRVCTPSFLIFKPETLNDIFVSEYWAYPQFIMDARIHGKKVARMSQHSIPGIVGRI